jgi:hypothetical protein
MVVLTRDKANASTSFIHEEISDGIFDEINNIVDANKVLAKGQKRFFFGATIYYRIYAERKHIVQNADDLLLLLHAAVFDFYAPCLFWVCHLPERMVAGILAELYLHPRVPAVRFLIRAAFLLGGDFADWLEQKWDQKWKLYSQPPQFYFSFHTAREVASAPDPRLVSTRLGDQTRIEIPGTPPVSVAELLASPTRAEELLSKACMEEFRLQGKSADIRGHARNLDCLAYGLEVRSHASAIHKLVLEMVGNQEPGDPGQPESSVSLTDAQYS